MLQGHSELDSTPVEGADPASADPGFTLIELLVVVVILGILIAIAIPTYRQFTKGAYEATAKSDLRTLELEQINYVRAHSGFATTAQLGAENSRLKLSPGSVGAVVWSSQDAFCVATANTKAPRDNSAPFAAFGFPYQTYFFDSTTGKISTTMCTAPSGAAGMDGRYIDEDGVH